MKPYLCWMIGVAAIVGCAVSVQADEPPPFAPDPISLDRASPSVVGFGNTPGDIYGESTGFLPGGWDVGGPGPILHTADTTYGLATPTDNNDGHSNGEFDPTAPLVIYFSGDDLSVGVAGTDYDHQAIRSQAAGDRFVVNGSTTLSPAAVMSGAGPSAIAGPVLPGGSGTFPTNLLSANQTVYNAIPTIAPTAFNTYVPPGGATAMDDMDALELTPFDLTGDFVHDTPIYFSLDAASPSLPASPADVLVSPPTLAGFGLFAPAPSLGLVATDELDALAVWDAAGDLIADVAPLTDFALFSLAPGSPTLITGGFSAADIFVTDFSGAFTLYLPASALGMAFSDNVDALDVEIFTSVGSIEVWDEVPEPSALALVGLGMLMMARRRAAA